MTQKVYVVGLGPGGIEQMTQRAKAALESCDVIAGYHVSAISASRAIMISARRTDQREERKKFTRALLHDDECAGPARR